MTITVNPNAEQNAKVAENNEASFATYASSLERQILHEEEKAGLIGGKPYLRFAPADPEVIKKEVDKYKSISENDLVNAIGGAVTDIPQDLANTAIALHDAYSKYGLGVDASLEAYRMTFSEELFPRSKDWGYNLLRDVGSFAASFGGLAAAAKGIKVTNTAAKFAKSMALSSAVDFTQADPNNENLFDLMNKYPALTSPISEALANDQTDMEITNRLRNALEGFMVGAPLELAVSGIGSLIVKAKANNALKARDIPISPEEVPASADYANVNTNPEAIDVTVPEEVVSEAEFTEYVKELEATDPKKAKELVAKYAKDTKNPKKNAPTQIHGMTVKKDVQSAKRGAPAATGRGMVSVGEMYADQFASVRKSGTDLEEFIEDARMISKEHLLSLDPRKAMEPDDLVAAQSLQYILHKEAGFKSAKWVADPTDANLEDAANAISEAALMQQLATAGGSEKGFSMRTIQQVQQSFGGKDSKSAKRMMNAAQDGITKGKRGKDLKNLVEAVAKESGIDPETMIKKLTDVEAEAIAKQVEKDARKLADSIARRGNSKVAEKIANNIIKKGVAEADKIRKSKSMPSEEFADKFLKIKPSEKSEEILRKTVNGQIKSFLIATRIGGLLSSPPTHLLNVMGNTYALGAEVATRAFGRSFSILRGSNGVKEGEVAAQMAGILDSFGESLRIWKRHFISGEKKYMSHKIDARTSFSNPESSKIVKGLDYAWNTSLRALGATDDAFKHLAFGMEQNRMLTLQAIDLDLPKEKIPDFFYTLKNDLESKKNAEYIEKFGVGYNHLQNLKDEIEVAAINFADMKTFTQKLEGSLGSIASGIQQSPLLNSLVPFLTANTNSFIMGAKDTPLYAVADVLVNRATFRDITKAAKADMLVGKMAYSSLIAATIAQFETTGSEPRNKQAKEVWKIQGKRPNQIKIGGTWVNTAKLGPISVPIQMIAETKQIMSEIQGDNGSAEVIEGLIGGLTATLAAVYSAEFLNVALAEALDLVSEKDQTAEDIEQKMVQIGAQYVSPFSAAFRAFNTPEDRNVKFYKGDEKGILGMWDDFKTQIIRTYGMDDVGLPIRNILGEPIKMQDGVPSNIMPVFATNQEDNSVLAKEAIRLFTMNEILPITNEDTRVTGYLRKPPRTITESADIFINPIRLTNTQYDRLQMMATGNVPTTKEYAESEEGQRVKKIFARMYQSALGYESKVKVDDDKQYTIRDVLEALIGSNRYNEGFKVPADATPEEIADIRRSQDNYKKGLLLEFVSEAQSAAVELMRADPEVRRSFNVKYNIMKAIGGNK